MDIYEFDFLRITRDLIILFHSMILLYKINSYLNYVLLSLTKNKQTIDWITQMELKKKTEWQITEIRLRWNTKITEWK